MSTYLGISTESNESDQYHYNVEKLGIKNHSHFRHFDGTLKCDFTSVICYMMKIMHVLV